MDYPAPTPSSSDGSHGFLVTLGKQVFVGDYPWPKDM